MPEVGALVKTCEECESGGEHAEWCSQASVTMTKQAFVDGAENATKAAFYSYNILRGIGGCKHG